MPLYNDINLYYGSSSITPTYPSSYSSPFSLPIRSGFSAGKLGLLTPPRLLPSRPMYSPLLPTISETTSFASALPRRPLGPLSRIGSPRITSTYLPPKPIRIDTADIDVSSPRVHRTDRIREQDQEGQEVSRPGTIKRGRTVIRLHTKRPKDNPALPKRKQTPGERLMEKFLIKDKIAEAAKEERQKRLEEQERLERLQAEETKMVEQTPPDEAHMPVMLTENAALDILVSTQEQQDSLVDDDEGKAKNTETKIGKEKTGKKKTKHDPNRRKSVPDENLWMMDEAAVEKSPLHRRNTVKKLRRNSHDLTNLETLTTSRRSSMDADIPEERETGEIEDKSEKKVTVKRKRGGKQKFVADVTVDNAEAGNATMKSPVKFVVGDVKVEESPASHRALAKKFRYEVIVEDAGGSQEKGKKPKSSGEKKIKKKVKGGQDKKQTSKSPKTTEEKGVKVLLTSEKTKEESKEDCTTSKSFQVSRHTNGDTIKNKKDYCVDVKQPVIETNKLANKDNLAEEKSDSHKALTQNKIKDKMDPSVERDEGYVSKRRRSSDPKLSKIKDKEVQNGVFVAEKKKSPIMVKIIPKMEDIKTGKRVIEKKKVFKRQEDPVISSIPGQTPTPEDSGVNFWAFLNSLDDEYQPVTLKTALSLDIVSPSDISSTDQKTSPASSNSVLKEDDDKVNVDSVCTSSSESKKEVEESKSSKSADGKPIPKSKLGKLADKKTATRDKLSTESKLKSMESLASKKEEKIPSTNLTGDSDSEKCVRKPANLLPATSKHLMDIQTVQENSSLEENRLPKWKVKKPLEDLNKQATKGIPDVSLKKITSEEKPLAKEIESTKEKFSEAKPPDVEVQKSEINSKLTSSETMLSNVKLLNDCGIEKYIPDVPEPSEKDVLNWKRERPGKPDERLKKHQRTDILPEKSGTTSKSADVMSNVTNSSTLSDNNVLTKEKEEFKQKIVTTATEAVHSTASDSNEPKGKILEKNIKKLEIQTPKWKINKKTEKTEKTEQSEKPPLSPSAEVNEITSVGKTFAKAELSTQNHKLVNKSVELSPETQLKSISDTKKAQEKDHVVNLSNSEGRGTPKWKVGKPTEKSEQPIEKDKGLLQSTAMPKKSDKTSEDTKKPDTQTESNALPEDDFWGVITGTATILVEEDTVKSPEVSKLTTEEKEETQTIKTLQSQNHTDKRKAKVKVGKVTETPRKPLKKQKPIDLLDKELKALSLNTVSMPEKTAQVTVSNIKDNLVGSPSKEITGKTVSKADPRADVEPTVEMSPKSLEKNTITMETEKCVPKKKVDKLSQPIKEQEKKKNVTTICNQTTEVEVKPVSTPPGKTNEDTKNTQTSTKDDSNSKLAAELSSESNIKAASFIPSPDPSIPLDKPTPKDKNNNSSEISKLIPKWKVKTPENIPKLLKPKAQIDKNTSHPLSPEKKPVAVPELTSKQVLMESEHILESGESAIQVVSVTAESNIAREKIVQKSEITTPPETKPVQVAPVKKLAPKVKFVKPGEKIEKSLASKENHEILKSKDSGNGEINLANEKKVETMSEEKELTNKKPAESAKKLKSATDTLDNLQENYTDKLDQKSKCELPTDSKQIPIESPKDSAQAKQTAAKNKKPPGVKISKSEDAKPVLKPVIPTPKPVTKKEIKELKDTETVSKIENVVSPEENVTVSEPVAKDKDKSLPTAPEQTCELKKQVDVKDAVSETKPKKKVKVKKGAKTKIASDTLVEPKQLINSSEVSIKEDELSSENVPEKVAPVKTVKLDSEDSGRENIDSCQVAQDISEKKDGIPIEEKEEGLEVSEDASNIESAQRSSTSSDDSGFDSLPTSKPVPSSSSSEGREPTSPAPSLASNPSLDPYDDATETTSRPGWHTPPAVSLPRFRKYTVEDFQFLKVLGKGSFGKVLLAELKGTDRYYAVKCLKKDVVLEDDDVECTLIERKVLALGTKHPYLCHLFCTFQTESHLLFVMEYLNGGDLMFHIQQSGRFPEPRARFYAAEIVCGLKFLHKKGIVYRDLKLDNILLDFEGHVRIADFGMCKLQIFLERTADTFCGTPDYMAPEIIKGLKYNQCVDWWSFGVLLFEMLVGVSPFNGCDEDELFWSICNEQPHYPRFLSRESSSILAMLLEKDASKRLGTPNSGMGDVADHVFFRNVDWVALEHRELDPPFKPRVQHPLDVQYFDKAFTEEKAILTPIDKGILQSMDQTQFQGFSYTNPNATD